MVHGNKSSVGGWGRLAVAFALVGLAVTAVLGVMFALGLRMGGGG